MSDSACLTAALEYGQLGLPVLPVVPRQKVPALKNWGNAATTAPESIRRSFRGAFKDCQVGIKTGTSFFVLDVDPCKGGESSLASLTTQHGSLPRTVKCLTGGGGFHLYFQLPEGIEVRNAVRVGGHAGLDIRGQGGFVVAPPSTHLSGHEYAWEASAGPGQVEMAPAPAWLIDLLRPPQDGKPLCRPDQSPPAPAQIPAGRRNSALTSLAGTMRRRGMGGDSIHAALREENRIRCSPPLEDVEVQTIARSVARYAPEPEALPLVEQSRARGEIPEIQVNGRWGADLLDDAWNAIAEGNRPPRLFRHAVWPLTCVRDGTLQPLSRDEFLGEYLERAARWTRVDVAKSGDLRQSASNFPTRLLGALHATPPETIPKIERLIRIPAFVGDDLELHDVDGFDSARGFYFHGVPVGIGEIPPEPTIDDLETGREVLRDWLREFEFADEIYRAHAIALLFTILARPGIDGNTPFFLVEAADPGTGKSCLVENVLLAAHGEKAAPAGIARDEDEIRKQVLSWVLGQESDVYLDNLNSITGARSRVLCALITSGGFRDRIMREHIVAGGKWHGVLIATANNPDVDVEMIRRIVRIRLECPVENPWSRKFSRTDFDTWTLQHRRGILRAVATAVQAWRSAGRPRGERIRPSFGEWSQVVGGVLQFVDPALAEAFLAEDDLTEAMAFGRGADEFREFATAWSDHAAAHAKREYTASELVGMGTATKSLPAHVVENRQGGEPSERSKAMRMSKYLVQVRGKVVHVRDARWRVMARPGRTNALVWSLDRVEEPA